MFGYLRGQVLESGIQSGDGILTIGVGSAEHGLVGYSVHAPRHPEYELLTIGKVIELFIYTHVREDSLDLYGFQTRIEKELFLTLLSVNGIGPKGALSILSNSEPTMLIQAIVDGNKALLTKIPGIGKKTAERVVLELAEPLRKKMDAALLPRKKAPAGAMSRDTGSQTLRDAVSALVGLGFRETDAASVVSRAFEESSSAKTEDLIKMALRQLT